MNWPNTADGDVFRSLESEGFDFTESVTIDFEIDFDKWPPSGEAMARLLSVFPNAEIFPPENGHDGYVHIKQDAMLTYEYVVEQQARISALLEEFGGVCEAWGVLHNAS